MHAKKIWKKTKLIKKIKRKEKVGLQSFFSFPIMSKQLTLFRKISGRIEPYFKKPQSMYEQCMNKSWQLNHEKYGWKQYLFHADLKEWEYINNDKKEVADYIKQDVPPAKHIRSSFIHHIPTTTSSTKGKPSNPLFVCSCSISSNSVPCQSPASNIPNVPVELSEQESYLKSKEH